MSNFEDLTKDELLNMYQNYEKLKAENNSLKLLAKEKRKRYYNTDRGKKAIQSAQKRYYEKNREKILAKMKEANKKKKEEKNKS